MNVTFLPTADREDEMDIRFSPSGDFEERILEIVFLSELHEFVAKKGKNYIRIKDVNDHEHPTRLVLRIKNDG